LLPIEGHVRRALAALVVLAFVVLASTADAAPARQRVLLFGDSLLVEATPQLRALATKAGFDVEVHAAGGTAICDWQAGADAARRRFRPTRTVLAFVGNNLTACTRHLSGPALGLQYGRDLAAIARVLQPSGPVYVVRPPARRWWDVTAQAVTAAYADAAQGGLVRLVDGNAYISPFGVWSATQPCMKGEPCTGPVVQKLRTNVVRAPDHLHFCPSGYDDGGCTEWSSGAYRYAYDIVDALVRDLGR
jgi:hypothetical protein